MINPLKDITWNIVPCPWQRIFFFIATVDGYNNGCGYFIGVYFLGRYLQITIYKP